MVLEAFMVEYTVFFPVLSTLTWDTLLTLRSTWGFYLNHLIPLRPFKSVFDNVLLEHGGLPHVLPLSVHQSIEFCVKCSRIRDRDGIKPLMEDGHEIPARPPHGLGLREEAERAGGSPSDHDT